MNGDFTILRFGDNGSVIGDGIDEHSFWIYDFGANSNFASLDLTMPLTSALLTLTLTPGASPIGDRAGVLFLPEFASPLFDSIPIGVTTTIQIELLNIYSSQALLDRIALADSVVDPRIPVAGPGQITVGYANDATVSFAELTLIGESVPEPVGVQLWGSAVLFLGALLWRQLRAEAAISGESPFSAALRE